MDCRRIGHQGAVHHKARCAPGDQGRLSGSSSRLRLWPRHSSCHGSFVLLLGHRLHRGKNLWPFRSPSPYIRAHFCDGTGRGCCLIQKLHAYIYIYIYMMNMLIIYLIICFILSAKSFIAYHLGVHKCREMDMVDRGYGTAGTCRHPERPTEGAWVKVHILYNFIYIYIYI